MENLLTLSNLVMVLLALLLCFLFINLLKFQKKIQNLPNRVQPMLPTSIRLKRHLQRAVNM